MTGTPFTPSLLATPTHVAQAAEGFTLAGWDYVFNREKYHTVARPAVLTALLGYTLGILALLVDLSQPWYTWYAINY